FSRTDVLFAIAERAQALSMIDIELHDWLKQGEARAWGQREDATWYKVQMPDVMGPVAAPAPLDLRSRWGSLKARAGLKLGYARGAICVPGTQGAGTLSDFGLLRFLDGLWCMPLGALREIVDADEATITQLITDCAAARVPISIAPQRFTQP